MDRQIIYAGQVPLETDLLSTNKNAMIGLSKLSAALLGTGIVLNGFTCIPTGVASLQVQLTAGEIYSLQNIDGTAYSSLASDTAHQIIKQGILLDTILLTATPPVTAGQSINHLVQATFAETDSNAVVLPYYNASNPAVAYSGPANAGTTNNTVRKGLTTVNIKAGIAATTGSQVTPAPDSGYTGMFVVTVANGQTTITAPNISTLSGAPFITETLMQKVGQASTQITATAGGTADALTATFTPAITTLVNGMSLIVRAASANATTTPTFQANGTAVKTIVKGNNLPLLAGDIAGAGHWIELQYDLTLDKWVLQNAAKGIVSGLNATNIFAFTATGALSATWAGATILLSSASAIVPTLPAASTVAKGLRYEFLNVNTGVATITRNGTDTITVNSTTTTSIAMGNGDTLTLESDGVSNWYAVGGSRQLGSSTDFLNSKAANGYTKLPNGLIIQWGSATTTGGGAVSVSFPITFPNAVYQCALGLLSASPVNAELGYSNLTTSGCTLNTNTGTGGLQLGSVSYMAIGY